LLVAKLPAKNNHPMPWPSFALGHLALDIQALGIQALGIQALGIQALGITPSACLAPSR
jgi:hypothetical protein